MTPSRGLPRSLVRLSLTALAVVGVLCATAAGRAQEPSAPGAEDRLRTFDEAWRIVRDGHFDPGMNGVDWNALRDELRPKAAAARSDDELREIIRDMVGRLHQSHFYVIPRDTVDVFDPDLLKGTGQAPADVSARTYGDPGLDVRLVGRDVLVTQVDADGPAAASGVRTGWIVQRVDGFDVAEMARSLPASLDERRAAVRAWGTVSESLHGAAGTPLRLTLLDGLDHARDVSITRRPSPGTIVQFGNLPPYVARLESRQVALGPDGGTEAPRHAGVIRFNVWMLPLAVQFDRAIDALRQTDGIVIDLRGNPGGVAGMIIGLAGHFLTEPISLGTMRMRDSELRFNANPRRVGASGAAVTPYQGPVAILVDGLTHSASEVFAGGMQSIKRARVFGERTAGGVLPALFDRLPNGDVLGHAFADFVTADGTRLEGRGVIPDEPVTVSRVDLLQGRDATADAALRWIAAQRTATKGAGR